MTHFIVKRRDLKPGELSTQLEINCTNMHSLWKNIAPSLLLTDADWMVNVELRITASRAIPAAAAEAAGGDDGIEA